MSATVISTPSGAPAESRKTSAARPTTKMIAPTTWSSTQSPAPGVTTTPASEWAASAAARGSSVASDCRTAGEGPVPLPAPTYNRRREDDERERERTCEQERERDEIDADNVDDEHDDDDGGDDEPQ